MRCSLCLLMLMVGLGAVSAACEPLPVYYSEDMQALPAPAGHGLVARLDSPLSDVPMPVGFVIIQARSRSQVDAHGRYIEHYYQGRGSLADTVGFYRKNLEPRQWLFINEQNIGGTVRMAYNKGRDTLELWISNDGHVSTVAVILQTRDPGTARGRN